MPTPTLWGGRKQQSYRIVDTFTPTADPADLRFFPHDLQQGNRHGGEKPRGSVQKAKPRNSGATTSRNMRLAVTIIGPGAGIHSNQEAWGALDQNPKLYLQVYGQSRGAYDRYPPSWPGGSPAPNLESLAEELTSSGVVENSHCIVLGSRGRQIVLPHLWSRFGDAMPPAIVINGGCALETPRPIVWPKDVVTLLVMGGQEYFRKPEMSVEQYMNEARERVPKTNGFTAQLVVPDMGHIPEPKVLEAVLSHRVFVALKSWSFSPSQFIATFQTILLELRNHGINASLFYTAAPGRWMNLQLPQRPPAPAPAWQPAVPQWQSRQPQRVAPSPPAVQHREFSERSPLQKSRTQEFSSKGHSYVPPARSYAPPAAPMGYRGSLHMPTRSMISVR